MLGCTGREGVHTAEYHSGRDAGLHVTVSILFKKSSLVSSGNLRLTMPMKGANLGASSDSILNGDAPTARRRYVVIRLTIGCLAGCEDGGSIWAGLLKPRPRGGGFARFEASSVSLLLPCRGLLLAARLLAACRERTHVMIGYVS